MPEFQKLMWQIQECPNQKEPLRENELKNLKDALVWADLLGNVQEVENAVREKLKKMYEDVEYY